MLNDDDDNDGVGLCFLIHNDGDGQYVLNTYIPLAPEMKVYFVLNGQKQRVYHLF